MSPGTQNYSWFKKKNHNSTGSKSTLSFTLLPLQAGLEWEINTDTQNTSGAHLGNMYAKIRILM